ncbi:MAG: GNAT family N-acetyltransferase [Clostridia bacterium]|nr:GNAT family N-acetyltransferase [Clostridia bacterium]
MMTTMYWAKPDEKREIVEFCDYVFSKAHRPHDFKTLLPKLYGEQGDGAEHHFVVREDGKLMATVLVYPVVMYICGARFMTLGVGSVSTHPDARGRGYMKALMDAVDQRAETLQADFAVLGGQRQRYAYFGYDYGGYQMNANLTACNVRHALAACDAQAYTIEEMTKEHVAQAMQLHAAQPCFCERKPEAFEEILRSWNNRPFAVMENGVFAGYGTMRQNADSCRIAELLLKDEACFPAVMKRLSSEKGDLTIAAAPWQKERADWLSRTCEEFAVSPNYNYKIYHAERLRSVFSGLGGGNESFVFHGFSLPLPLYIAPADAV